LQYQTIKKIIIMTTQNINSLVAELSNDQVSELLYALCRSGKCIIPQYFDFDTIKEIKGDISNQEILDIQLSVEQKDSLMENIYGEIW